MTFTGRADPAMIAEHLSAATIGLCPDLKTPLNDVSTMNKTMEYMAYALPSVSFDLVETRVSGRRRLPVRAVGRRRRRSPTPSSGCSTTPSCGSRWPGAPGARVSSELDWRPQAAAYVGVFERILPTLGGPTSDAATEVVDVDSEDEFRRFVLGRGPMPTQRAVSA